jgi:hypothetical protein
MRGSHRAATRAIDIGAVLAAPGVDERAIIATLRKLLESVGEIEFGIKPVLGVGRVPDSLQRVHEPCLGFAAPDLELCAIVGESCALFRSRLFARLIDRAFEGKGRSAMIRRAVLVCARDADPCFESDVVESKGLPHLRRHVQCRDSVPEVIVHPLHGPEFEQGTGARFPGASLHKGIKSACESDQPLAIDPSIYAVGLYEGIALGTVLR